MEALSTTMYTTKQVPLCPHHSEYKLEIFCKTRDTLVCSMCMLESSHKGHSYDVLKNVQHELMKRIKSTTQSIERKETKSNLVLFQLRNLNNECVVNMISLKLR